MTAYSFGNRWMGIVSLREPGPSIPLHKMAIQQERLYVIAGNSLPASELAALVRSVRQKCTMQGDSTRASTCDHIERGVRQQLALTLPSWLVRAVVAEIDLRRKGARGQSSAPSRDSRRAVRRRRAAPERRHGGAPARPDNSKSSRTPQEHGPEQSPAQLQNVVGDAPGVERDLSIVELNWDGATPDLPDMKLLPVTLVRMSQVLNDLDIDLKNIDDRSMDWLRLACVHRSYHYEHLSTGPVAATLLDVLGGVGKAWSAAAVVETMRLRAGGFGSAAEASSLFQPTYAQFRSELAEWVRVEGIAQLGRGERLVAQEPNRNSSFETVGLQIVGALSLLQGTGRPASMLVRRFTTRETNVGADWVQLVQAHLKREPVIQTESEGPDHARSFTVTLLDQRGNSSIGRGSSKKAARREASRLYIERFAPALAQTTRSDRQRAPAGEILAQGHSIGVGRLVDGFGLPPAARGLVSQSLIHASWAYEHPRELLQSHQRSNEVLAFEGSYIASALVSHQHALSVLARTFSPAADAARFPLVTAASMVPLFDGLGLDRAVLTGVGQDLSEKIKGSTAQAVLGSAWNALGTDALAKAVPKPVADWIGDYLPHFDSTGALSRYCNRVGLRNAFLFESRGPAHGMEFRTVWTFGDSARWIGPWAPGKAPATTWATDELFDLVLDQMKGQIEGLHPDELDVVAAFIAAEVGSAGKEKRQGASSLLAADLVVAGEIASYADWVGGLEGVVDRVNDLAWPSPTEAFARLSDYYSESIRGACRSALKSAVLEPALRLRTIGRGAQTVDQDCRSSVRATMNAAELIIENYDPSGMRVVEAIGPWRNVDEANDSASGLGATLMPGVGRGVRHLLELGGAVAYAVDQELEVLVGPIAEGRVSIAVRASGVNLLETLAPAINVLAALVPGVSARGEENTLVFLLPVRPVVGDSRFMRAAVNAYEKGQDRDWLVQVHNAVAELRRTTGAAPSEGRLEGAEESAIMRLKELMHRS